MNRPRSDDPGDTRAVEAVQGAAFTSARRLLQQPEAEDAAADAVVDALEKKVQLENPGAWGNTVGANNAKSEIRRQKRQAKIVDPNELPEPERTAPSAERQALLSLMHAELNKIAERDLTEPQLEAYRGLVASGGHFADAVKYVASMTNRHPGTVRTHLNRAIRKLQIAAAHLNEGSE